MRIGSKLLLAFALLALTVAAANKKKAAEPYALVGGTVFRDPGFALPEAQVSLEPAPVDSQSSIKNWPIKKLTSTSDARGEFVFRVPTGAMRYMVRATSKGYAPQTKSVTVEGEERVDATFTLLPESK